MRILVLGASGQVGTHLVLEAKAQGYDVTASSMEELDLSTLTDSAKLDVSAYDGVINAAAFTAVDMAETEEELAQQLNAYAPGLLAEACAAADIPLVHYSTDYVFDGRASNPYTEEMLPDPINAYGRTKLAGEEAVLRSGAVAGVIRLSWVFSSYGKNFVKTMLRLGDSHGGVRVVDDQLGKPTPARAAAMAGLTALKTLADDPAKAGLYHYAGDEAVSWAVFAQAIFEAWGRNIPVTPIPTTEFPTPAPRPGYSVLSTNKFEQAFGMVPADWRAELPDIIKALKDQGEIS